MSVECAFLSELDAEEIFDRLRRKVEGNERLDDRELMEFIIVPLSYRKKEEKQRKIQETVQLAARIQDRGRQLFALSGILAFTDKVIDRETANKIRRAIEMTQIAQIFEEEKQQAEKKAEKLAYRQIVVQMLRKDYSSEEIVSVVSSYSQNDVEKLRKELAKEGN